MASYNEMVGDRLRSIRRARGFSLQDVQKLSGGEFKAAVLGAYERGERSLSLVRLQRLSGFYSMSVAQVLPADEPSGPRLPPPESGGVTIVLDQVESIAGVDATIMQRFLRSIQLLRQDPSGEVLTIRTSDLRTLSLLFGLGDYALSDRLTELGVAADGA